MELDEVGLHDEFVSEDAKEKHGDGKIRGNKYENERPQDGIGLS